jgi:hypothetical protein
VTIPTYVVLITKKVPLGPIQILSKHIIIIYIGMLIWLNSVTLTFSI